MSHLYIGDNIQCSFPQGWAHNGICPVKVVQDNRTNLVREFIC